MKYLISGSITISMHTEVEADSKTEALQIAALRELCSLSNPYMHGETAEDCWCHSGELDGEVEVLDVEEM